MSQRSDWAFRLLLRLYPAAFRERYGRAMLDFHRDRIAAARAAGESPALLWLRLVLDALSSALAEHSHSLTRHEAVIPMLIHDLVYAARGLRHRPGFTLIVVATMALGIGANAAIFAVVNAILLQPLPYPHPERLVNFGHDAPQWLTSEPDFLDYHRELRSFSGLAAYTRREGTLTGGDEPERLQVVQATDDFFPVLGVRPLVGRTFVPDEFAVRPARTVVLSYGLWQRRFGGDRGVLGRAIAIEGVQRTVVGVMPPQFAFPTPRTDVWLPMPRFSPDSMNSRDNHSLFMLGRLAPNATLASAFVEANGIAKRFMREFPNLYNPREPLTPHLTFVTDEVIGGTRPYLFALLGAVGFVLLIACANVANLLLVRSETRQKEMAIRSALGASRFRLLGQLLVESMLLAGVGGLLAILLAWGGERLLVSLAPGSIPRLDEIRLDWHVIAFTAAVTLATGLAVGLVPGLRSSGNRSADALKAGGRLASSGGAARGAREALVVAELTLAVITLAGSGMLLRSLRNLEARELGFDPRQVLTARIGLSTRGYDDARAASFYEQLLTAVRGLPGVVGAGAANWLPIVDAGGLRGARPDERDYPPGQFPQVVPQWATPGFLPAMGIPLLSGRDFTSADTPASTPVVIVSKRLAELFWPNENPLGRRMKLGAPHAAWLTVIGVAGDFRSNGFADTPQPTMYVAYAQGTMALYYQPSALSLVMRAGGDPATLARSVRAIVHTLDPSVPVSYVRTMEQIVGISVANRRFSTLLLASFAGLALLLAGIGTYGVISYGVTQRRFEIGVRLALGAGDRSVLTLVMSEALRMCAIGIVLGLVGAAAIGRGLRALLVGISPLDATALVGASAALFVVAMLACLLPARRALRVNPVAVLRGG